MKMKFVLWLFLIVLMQPTKIFAQRAYPDSLINKSVQASKHKYHFSKKKNVKRTKEACINGIVDTTSIYVNAEYDTKYGDTLYNFWRFFCGGEVFISYGYLNTPTKEEYNDLSYGYWAMYKIRKNKLIVEFYQPVMVGTIYDFAEIKKDEIRFYKSRIGRLFTNSTKPINYTLKRQSAEFKTHKIDW